MCARTSALAQVYIQSTRSSFAYSDAITRCREIAISFATRRTNNGKTGDRRRVEATNSRCSHEIRLSNFFLRRFRGRGNELTRTYAGVSRFEKRESVEACSRRALRSPNHFPSRSNSPDEKRSESFQLAVPPLARQKIRAVVTRRANRAADNRPVDKR